MVSHLDGELYPRVSNIQQDYFAKYRKHLPADERLVHVDIDDGTVRALGRYLSWQRTRFADAVDVLDEMGARLILFDVLLSDVSAPVLTQRRGQTGIIADTQRRFDLLESALSNLIDEIGAGEAESIPTSKALDVLRQVRKEVAASGRATAQTLDEAIHSPDEILAASIRRAGNVLLPLHLAAVDSGVDQAAVQRLKDAVAASFGMNVAEAAEVSGLPVEFVKERLIHVKRLVASERAGERVDALTGDVAKDAAALFTGQSALPEAEMKIIAEAVDRERAAALIRRRDLLDAPDVAATTIRGRAQPPIYDLTKGARHVGMVNAYVDELDSVLRRSPLYRAIGDRVVLHLSVLLAAECLGVPKENIEIIPGRYIIFHHAPLPEGESGDLLIPVDVNGRHRLNFAPTGDKGWSAAFRHVPFGALVELADVRRAIRRNGELRTESLIAIDEHFFQPPLGLRDLQSRFEEASRRGDDSAIKQLAAEIAEMDARIAGSPLAAQAASVSEEALEGASDEEVRMMRLLQLLYGNLAEIRSANEALARREQRLADDLRSRLHDRACIVGATFTGNTDDKSTPVGIMPGVMLYSHFVNGVLQDRFLHRLPPLGSGALFLAFTAVALALSIRWSPAASGPAIAVVIVLYLACAFVAYDRLDLMVEPRPLLSAIAVFGAVTSYRVLFEQKRGRFIKGVFSHYLHPDVVSELTENPDAVKLGGDTKEVTLFFSDIAGFTPISESLSSAEVVSLLNDYLGRLSAEILKHRGLLDKYEGDAIMAIFGAPKELPNHAASACLAALDAQQAARTFNEERSKLGKAPLHTRIGLNSGRCVVGNIGSAQRLDYTAIGDAVNLASRLEGANKAFDTNIMISETTYMLAKDHVEVRALDLIRVKGKTRPTEVYELLARKGELDAPMSEVIRTWDEALALCRGRHWDEAATLFESILAFRDDGPSKAYLDRCHSYKTNPPPPDWDGVFVMAGK